MKLFKHSVSSLFLSGLVAVFAGCAATPADYEKNNNAAQAWLNSQPKAPPAINISGKWDAEDWGEAEFRQSGRSVTGTMDRYPVKGFVSGKNVYLTIWEENWCYYLAHLQARGKDTLEGVYCKEPPYKPKKTEPMRLHRKR